MDKVIWSLIFNSYEILHAFELPQPTFALDWNSDGNGKNIRAYNILYSLKPNFKVMKFVSHSVVRRR